MHRNNLIAKRKKNKVYIITSSTCRINNVDSERLRAFFKLNGYQITEAVNEADLVMVNTCGNRQERIDESVDLIEKVKKQKKERAVLIVCGCFPVIHEEKLRSVFDGIFLGPLSYNRLDEIINAKIKFSETGRSFVLKDKKFVVPICEGCIWNCSYCVLKKARGGELRSRKLDSILDDIKAALSDGHRVIELQGEEVGSYGIDMGTDFPTLLDKIINIKGNFSIFIFRLNPYWFFRYFSSLRKLLSSRKVKLVSIPIQSGSAKILKRMNRKYQIKDIKRCIKILQGEAPHLKILTDIIVGFPGEGNEDFLESLNLIKEVNFNLVRIYKFTRWEKAAAYKYSDIVSKAVVEKRYKKLKNRALLGSFISNVFERK